MDAIKFVQDQMLEAKALADFKVGDNISVKYKIIEGDKERIQTFKGDVLQIKGSGRTKMFTVRKMSGNVGVERIFPYSSPNLVEVEINKRGKVRRSRLFYLRNLVGKKAKIKEKTFVGK
jgi:large subunit ribosomal protein L19